MSIQERARRAREAARRGDGTFGVQAKVESDTGLGSPAAGGRYSPQAAVDAGAQARATGQPVLVPHPNGNQLLVLGEGSEATVSAVFATGDRSRPYVTVTEAFWVSENPADSVGRYRIDHAVEHIAHSCLDFPEESELSSTEPDVTPWSGKNYASLDEAKAALLEAATATSPSLPRDPFASPRFNADAVGTGPFRSAYPGNDTESGEELTACLMCGFTCARSKASAGQLCPTCQAKTQRATQRP